MIDEQWLTEVGAFSVELVDEVDLGLVDLQAGLDNQVRITPLDPKIVERYAVAMQNGERFPPVILRHVSGKAHYVPMDGNHRLAAARAAKTTVRAYVVKCDDLTALQIITGANVRHGKPLTDQERTRQALRLVDRYEWSFARAASHMGVTQSSLQTHKRIRTFAVRARELGITDADLIKNTSKARLTQIGSDEVFKAAVEMCRDTRMTAPDVLSFVTRINAVDDDEQAMLMIASEADDRFQQVLKSSRPIRAQLVNACTNLRDFNPNEVADSCVTEEQRRMLEDTMLRTAKHLQKIAQAVRANA